MADSTRLTARQLCRATLSRQLLPGAVAVLMRGADVTFAEAECPIVHNFTVHDSGTVFSVDPAVLPRVRDTYGIDVLGYSANHQFDEGLRGFLESLDQLKAARLPYFGAGRNLDEALTRRR